MKQANKIKFEIVSFDHTKQISQDIQRQFNKILSEKEKGSDMVTNIMPDEKYIFALQDNEVIGYLIAPISREMLILLA